MGEFTPELVPCILNVVKSMYDLCVLILVDEYCLLSIFTYCAKKLFVVRTFVK